MTQDTDQRHEERARHVPELVDILTALVDDAHPSAPATHAARRLLDEVGDDRDGRHFCSLVSALRGVVSGGGDGTAFERARAWMSTRCRGCGAPVQGRRDACKACVAAWQQHIPIQRGAA
jgi:hypothetical protein